MRIFAKVPGFLQGFSWHFCQELNEIPRSAYKNYICKPQILMRAGFNLQNSVVRKCLDLQRKAMFLGSLPSLRSGWGWETNSENHSLLEKNEMSRSAKTPLQAEGKGGDQFTNFALLGIEENVKKCKENLCLSIFLHWIWSGWLIYQTLIC